jgi:hypothetical protein
MFPFPVHLMFPFPVHLMFPFPVHLVSLPGSLNVSLPGTLNVSLPGTLNVSLPVFYMLILFFYLDHGSSTFLQKSGNYPTKYVCHVFTVIVIRMRTSNFTQK